MSSVNCEVGNFTFTLGYAEPVLALNKVARGGDLQNIEKLLEKVDLRKIEKLLLKGGLPHVPDDSGWTMIHRCVQANQVEVLKLILKIKSEK